MICLFLGLAEPTPATISRTVSGRFGNGRTTSSEGVLGSVGCGKEDVSSRALWQGTAPLGMPSAPYCTHLGCGWSVKSVSISSARPSMVFCSSRAAERIGQRHAVVEARVSSQGHGDARISCSWLPAPAAATSLQHTVLHHYQAPCACSRRQHMKPCKSQPCLPLATQASSESSGRVARAVAAGLEQTARVVGTQLASREHLGELHVHVRFYFTCTHLQARPALAPVESAMQPAHMPPSLGLRRAGCYWLHPSPLIIRASNFGRRSLLHFWHVQLLTRRRRGDFLG